MIQPREGEDPSASLIAFTRNGSRSLPPLDLPSRRPGNGDYPSCPATGEIYRGNPREVANAVNVPRMSRDSWIRLSFGSREAKFADAKCHGAREVYVTTNIGQ